MHGEIDNHAHIRHTRREWTDASNGDRQDVLVADRFLDRLDGRIEALDMADHEDDAGQPRGGNDRAALVYRRCDRLLDQNMRAALDADQRKFPMQVGRGRDRHRIDPFGQQRLDSANALQPSTSDTKSRCLRSGSAYADELDPRQIGKDACVIAAHDADADHPYP